MFGYYEEEEQEPIDLSKLDTTSDLYNRTKAVIEEEVSPTLAADGGDIKFLGMNGTVAIVELQGACAHCPSATITLQYGVQSMLVEAIPEITGVRRA